MAKSYLRKLLPESVALVKETAVTDGEGGVILWNDNCRIIGRLRREVGSEKMGEGCHGCLMARYILQWEGRLQPDRGQEIFWKSGGSHEITVQL